MRIIVSRPPGDKLAPEPIINPLATQQNIGVELGKTFIYDSMTYNEYVIRMPYRREVYPGEILAVHDDTLGESFVARVVGHEITLTKSDANGAVVIQSVITIWRILING